MYPTSMRINEEGRLVVNFKTEARFRGQFVMSHPGMHVQCTHPKPILCGHSVQAASDYPVVHILSLSIYGVPPQGSSCLKDPEVIQQMSK